MTSKILTAIVCWGSLLTGCFKTPLSSEGSVNEDGSGSTLASYAEGTTDSKSIATVDANATTDIQLTAPAVEGLSGASITIPPGSLAVSVNLVVEEAADFSDTSMSNEIGLTDSIQVASATPGMLIRPSESVDLKKPLTLSMPLPATTGLWLATASKYAVLYKYFDPSEQRLVTGMKVVDGSTVKLAFDEKSGKDLLSFEGYFGAYWAVVLSREVDVAEVPAPKAAEEPIMNKAKVTVIANTGVVKETEIVKTQAIPEIVWGKTSIAFTASTRSLKVTASVPSGQTVSGCKADFFESAAAKSGLIFDSPNGTTYDYATTNAKAHTLVGRFRCVDSSNRMTVTPWSDIVSVPAVASSTTSNYDLPNLTLTVSGQLSVPTRKLLAFTLRPDHSESNYSQVAVASTGKFTATIPNRPVYAQRIALRLAASPIDRSEAFKADIMLYFGVSLAEVNQVLTENPNDADLRSFLNEELSDTNNLNAYLVLAAYTADTSSKENEAKSFQFVGYNVNGGLRLLKLPITAIKSPLDLGTIDVSSTSSDVAPASIAGYAAVNLPTATVDIMATSSQGVKSVRNAYLSPGWRAEVSSLMKWSYSLSSLTTSFSEPSTSNYYGYGFYIQPPSGSGLVLTDICSGTSSLKLLAPSEVSTTTGTSQSYFWSGASTLDTSTAGKCSNSDIFASEEADDNGDTRLMLNFGTGNKITSEGTFNAWTLQYAGSDKAKFLFQDHMPFLNSTYARTLVPSIRFEKSGSNYVSATVKFYSFNVSTSAYELITDGNLVRSLIGRAHVFVSGTNIWDRIEIPLSTSSESTVVFTTSYPDTSLTKGGVEFQMDGQTYRFETYSY